MTFDEHVQTFLDDLTDVTECRDLAKAAIAADIREQKLLATRHIWTAWLARTDGQTATQSTALDHATSCADRIHRGVAALQAMEPQNKVQT